MAIGSMARIKKAWRVSQMPRPLYCRAKISQAVGRSRMPRYSSFSQKILVGRSVALNSNVLKADQIAVASMSSAKAPVPSAGRLRQPNQASAAFSRAEKAGMRRRG